LLVLIRVQPLSVSPGMLFIKLIVNIIMLVVEILMLLLVAHISLVSMAL
jgi:hypothetical protein